MDEMRAKRRAAMAVLAESSRRRDRAFAEALGPLPAHEDMRAPENGLVMIRGRIGGDGAQFNLGEATVSRAVVRLATGEMGFGYVLGRDRAKARLIALCDALVQTEAYSAALESKVIAPFAPALKRNAIRARGKSRRQRSISSLWCEGRTAHDRLRLCRSGDVGASGVSRHPRGDVAAGTVCPIGADVDGAAAAVAGCCRYCA